MLDEQDILSIYNGIFDRAETQSCFTYHHEIKIKVEQELLRRILEGTL